MSLRLSRMCPTLHANRLLPIVVDFSINKQYERCDVDVFDLGLVRVEGAVSVSIRRWRDIGLPQPEALGGDYVLEVVVPAGGTVTASFPFYGPVYTPYLAYVTVLARGELLYRFYHSLGGKTSSARNAFPLELRLPENTWGRFNSTWFIETHHGGNAFVVEARNPSSMHVKLYIALFASTPIGLDASPNILLYGWEDGFYAIMPPSETSGTIYLFTPPPPSENMVYQFRLRGSFIPGTNASVTVTPWPPGRWGYSYSGSGTSTETFSIDYNLYPANRSGPTMERSHIDVSFIGNENADARLTSFTVWGYGYQPETIRQGYAAGTIPARQAATVACGEYRHIASMTCVARAPFDAPLDFVVVNPDGAVRAWQVPAGTTETVAISTRAYVYQIINNSNYYNATVRCSVVCSESVINA